MELRSNKTYSESHTSMSHHDDSEKQDVGLGCGGDNLLLTMADADHSSMRPSPPSSIEPRSTDSDNGVNTEKAMARQFTSHVIKRSKKRSIIAVVHFNIFLYSTCFWIQTGVLPYLIRSLNLDTIVFGYLQTTHFIIQLIGGPLYGRFADIYGGRAALTLAFAAAASMYALLGAANSIFLIFLSRVPSLFLHAFQGTQMVIVDVTEPSQRAAALGQVSLSYCFGMVVGPLIGGQIANKFSEQSAAFTACFGSLLGLAIVLKYIPENLKGQGRKVDEERKQSEGVFSATKLITLVSSSPRVFGCLFLMFISSIPCKLFHSMLSVITMEVFELTADQTGFLLSYTGIITCLADGVLITIITKRCSESLILKCCIVLLLVSFVLLAFVSNIQHLILVLLPMTCGQAIIGTVLASSLTNTVSVADTGAILGLGHACHALVSTISPTIGVYLLEQFGIIAFGIIGAAVYTLLILCQ